MNEEAVQQRISYLVEHGGIYPMARPLWLKWAVVMVALDLVTLGVLLLM